MEEELLANAVTLKKESEETEVSLNFVNGQIAELEEFKMTLKTLEENKEREILASLGKGVFLKAERKNDNKLFVDVGAGFFVRKTPKEALSVISEQIVKFKEAKIHLIGQLRNYASQFKEMLKEVEKIRKEKVSKH